MTDFIFNSSFPDFNPVKDSIASAWHCGHFSICGTANGGAEDARDARSTTIVTVGCVATIAPV